MVFCGCRSCVLLFLGLVCWLLKDVSFVIGGLRGRFAGVSLSRGGFGRSSLLYWFVWCGVANRGCGCW